MFSTQGFSPALLSLKSGMVHFGASNKFVGTKLAFLNGVGVSGVTHKVVCQGMVHLAAGRRSVTRKVVVCQALGDKPDDVPRTDLDETQREMEQMRENRLQAILISVLSAEKRLQEAKDAYESAQKKGNADAGVLELLEKKVGACEREVDSLKLWYRSEGGKGI